MLTSNLLTFFRNTPYILPATQKPQDTHYAAGHYSMSSFLGKGPVLITLISVAGCRTPTAIVFKCRIEITPDFFDSEVCLMVRVHLPLYFRVLMYPQVDTDTNGVSVLIVRQLPSFLLARAHPVLA